MHFTVVKLFNHKSFGLDTPHYAVVADMPLDMGGGQRVVDMFPESRVVSAAHLSQAFAAAKEKMPHRVSPDGGGEIDFYNTDYRGQRVKQNTAYIPAKPLTGTSFEKSLIEWLSWRTRVGLRMQDAVRPALSEKMEARILETVVSPQALPKPSVTLPALSALEARVMPQKRNDYLADSAPAPLTQGLAPL